MSKIILCPNEEKKRILEENQHSNNLFNQKYITKKEFMDNYFFSYDETAYEYLMNQYGYHLDVCKVYLKNLYPIDVNTHYHSDKINFLKKIKIELLEKNLLKENKPFQEFIHNSDIEIKSYYELEKYIEKAIGKKIELEEAVPNFSVVKCKTLEEEVNDVCIKIRKLLKDGVDINHIYLSNVSNDYYYTIEKLFSYYQIPINLDKKKSIYGTKVVKDYLETKELDLENTSNFEVTKLLVNGINSLVKCNPNLSSYEILLKDKLKNTSIPYHKKENAVNIKELDTSEIKDTDYLFVLGFNQDILPKMEKDIDYLSDKEKEELDLYKTYEINTRRKKVLLNLLGKVKHLNISYKESSPFSNFLKSSLIEEYHIEEIDPIEDTKEYTNRYNEIRLGEEFDSFYKYGEENSTLKLLNTHYNIPYNTYSNHYTGIPKDFYKNLTIPYNMSYSSIDKYSECPFKYYANYILNLSDYEEKFPSFVGNLYHYILSKYQEENFDFEKEYEYYLQNRELSAKEKLLLGKIKKDLIDLVESLKKQQLITGYDNAYFERKIEIPLPDHKIPINVKGFIDKIMYLKKNGETYYSIVDYKSGFIDTNIEPMKYGLHMQLPMYLYLIKNSNLFENPVFTGIYYQSILYRGGFQLWNNTFI